MDKLQLTGQSPSRVFNFRSGYLCAAHLGCYKAKLPSLKLKTWAKQLLGSLSLHIVLTSVSFSKDRLLIFLESYILCQEKFFGANNLAFFPKDSDETEEL